jgi:hypothetical protein
MGSLRAELRRLRGTAEGEKVAIPQRDGPPKLFTKQDMKYAFVNVVARGGAGEDAPPEHAVLEAVRNSSDPEWINSFYFVEDPEKHTQSVEDLSEP